MSGFSGNPKTEWLDEPGPDRRMQLLDDFSYTDPDGHEWPAPKGSVIDGASIPAPLWSVVGSPYTGDYRRASVVHDVACGNASIPREQADRMFYFACIDGGCSLREAQLLYAGVRIGAWAKHIRMWSPDETHNALLVTGTIQPTLTEQSVRTTFTEIAKDIDSRPRDMPFAELERIVNAHLAAKSRQ